MAVDDPKIGPWFVGGGNRFAASRDLARYFTIRSYLTPSRAQLSMRGGQIGMSYLRTLAARRRLSPSLALPGCSWRRSKRRQDTKHRRWKEQARERGELSGEGATRSSPLEHLVEFRLCRCAVGCEMRGDARCKRLHTGMIVCGQVEEMHGTRYLASVSQGFLALDQVPRLSKALDWALLNVQVLSAKSWG
jgi:hypothetical protein